MTGVEGAPLPEPFEAARTPPALAPDCLTGEASAEAHEASGLATENERLYEILFIEDDPEGAALLSEEFDRRGYAVFVASDALQGLSLILRWQPDLVLSRVSIPSMSGMDILKRLHQIAPHCARTPFIFTTGLAERESEATGRAVAAADFFAEPIGFETLLKRVEVRLARDSKVGLALTEREAEVLMWMARGNTRNQVAEIMSIKVRTVIFYLSRAQKKLGAATSTEAVVKAPLRGLIEP